MYSSQCWFDKYLLVKEIPLDAYGPGIEPLPALMMAYFIDWTTKGIPQWHLTKHEHFISTK